MIKYNYKFISFYGFKKKNARKVKNTIAFLFLIVSYLSQKKTTIRKNSFFINKKNKKLTLIYKSPMASIDWSKEHFNYKIFKINTTFIIKFNFNIMFSKVCDLYYYIKSFLTVLSNPVCILYVVKTVVSIKTFVKNFSIKRFFFNVFFFKIV